MINSVGSTDEDESDLLQMQPIRMGVIDGHPYVRRTAVMGVLKVYNLDSTAVKNAGKSSPQCLYFFVLDLCVGSRL